MFISDMILVDENQRVLRKGGALVFHRDTQASSALSAGRPVPVSPEEIEVIKVQDREFRRHRKAESKLEVGET